MEMKTVTSADGKQIAYWRSGSGPPLVLVHGGLSDRSAWVLVQPLLEEQFTVYAMNRRGREGSGAPAPYAIEREFEDIVAVIESAGEPVHLLGHSSGAVCCLGAALMTDRLRSLTLYEPPLIDPRRAVDGEGILALVNAGKNEEAAIKFFREGPQVREADLALLRASPIWAHLVSLAPTMPPEFAALLGYDFDAQKYADFDIPMLLLVGGDSPRSLWTVNEALRDVAPNTKLVELPGQQHGANLAAPELFVSEVVGFLEEVEARV